MFSQLIFLLFLSYLFIAYEVKFIINPGKLSLSKEIKTFASAFFHKLANQEPKYSADFELF